MNASCLQMRIGTNCKRVAQEGIWLGGSLHWQVYSLDMPNRAIQEETCRVDWKRKGLGEKEKDVWRHYRHWWEILQETQIQSIDYSLLAYMFILPFHPYTWSNHHPVKMYKHLWIAKLGYIKMIPQLVDHLRRLVVVHMSFGIENDLVNWPVLFQKHAFTTFF